MRARVGAVLVAAVAFGCLCSSAAAAGVTPGWECVPTTAGADVVSGGTASAPSCAAGTTAVLAPTYVSSGVGGKPTVQFAAVNVQILDGAGSTASHNGEGNLILGYDESPGTQSGSHDVVLGQNQTFTGYGDLVAGIQSNVTGNYAAAFGYVNKVTGSYSLVSGDQNSVTGTASTAVGGFKNVVTSSYSSLLGGCSNAIGTTAPAVSSLCSNTTNYDHDFATISGGAANLASGISSSITGGYENGNTASSGAILGGSHNSLSGTCTSIPAIDSGC